MKKRDLVKGFYLFLSLVDMAVIFWMSSQSGEQSGQLSSGLAEKLLSIFSGSGEINPQTVANIEQIIRMLGHFTEFFLLGLFVILFINTYKISKKKIYLFALVFCLIYSISDEIHQIFVPGRAFEIADMAINIAGSAAGILLFALINKMAYKIKIHSGENQNICYD
jgi:VanZ family protein